MNEVQFQEWRPPQYKAQVPKIVQWLIAYSGGLVKNEKQATQVILGMAIAMAIISVFLFLKAVRSPAPLPADQIIKVAGPGRER